LDLQKCHNDSLSPRATVAESADALSFHSWTHRSNPALVAHAPRPGLLFWPPIGAIGLRDPAIILIIGIAVGLAVGYGIRELISRRRAQDRERTARTRNGLSCPRLAASYLTPINPEQYRSYSDGHADQCY